MRRSRPAGAAPLLWEEFEDLFLQEFLPETVRISRAYEFEWLTQAGCGSIDEYANRFLELSAYASGLVDTERRKVDRFVYGLQPQIRRVMVGQTHVSLTEAIDKARRIELMDAEGGGSDTDPRKRARVEATPQVQVQIQGGPQFHQPQVARGQIRPGVGQQGPAQNVPPCITCGKRHVGACQQPLYYYYR